MELNSEMIKNFEWMIDHDYKVNFMIDNLPALTEQKNLLNYFTGENFVNAIDVGFQIGNDYFS